MLLGLPVNCSKLDIIATCVIYSNIVCLHSLVTCALGYPSAAPYPIKEYTINSYVLQYGTLHRPQDKSEEG